MVNLMREHVPDGTRIHYVITSGGSAPNVVPDFAEAYYYARHQDAKIVRDVWERFEKAAQGAAMGTGTSVEVEVVNGVYALLPNESLARVIDTKPAPRRRHRLHGRGACVRRADRDDAARRAADLRAAEHVRAFAVSDAGGIDRRRRCELGRPELGFSTATWVPGTPAHSWQAVAAGGMSIGHRGMLNAAKTMAMSVFDLMADPQLIAAARAEFDAKRGAGFTYRPLIGDRKPPLDYRVNPSRRAGGSRRVYVASAWSMGNV